MMGKVTQYHRQKPVQNPTRSLLSQMPTAIRAPQNDSKYDRFTPPRAASNVPFVPNCYGPTETVPSHSYSIHSAVRQSEYEPDPPIQNLEYSKSHQRHGTKIAAEPQFHRNSVHFQSQHFHHAVS